MTGRTDRRPPARNGVAKRPGFAGNASFPGLAPIAQPLVALELPGMGQPTSSFTWRGGTEMETEGTLSSAWDQHLASEFDAKSAEQALATMTAEPHVNIVPLMIGARGRTELHDFYANHFLSQIPPDM